MRPSWSIFVLPTVLLLPIVAADFHAGSVTCKQFWPWVEHDKYGVIVPGNRDACDVVSGPYSNQGFKYGPEMTATLCGATITISNTQSWTSSDGGSGICYQINGGSGVDSTCWNGDFGECTWTDHIWCESNLCK
ncbi:uncharacterized protein EI90DRAFT_3055165 [Cantharellus anzutake]|uniref:uncharacterized protein n=1 Tax=Cantharellus anzutake TaxID=1750568 RepID=UPI001906855F|nr:uncharacterized protein EI90DRAFT_3055165 [Cantharellus anzutake]KAF8332338.1 hypothetical protein EI90DRAFT_3055165 [Cantharellus anzutake]